MKEHTYSEVIKAWADGATVQSHRYATYGKVKKYLSDWITVKEPDFNARDVEWRVKPETVNIKYRVALMQDDLMASDTQWLNTAMNKGEEKTIRGEGAFVTWLTPWINLGKVEI